MDNKYYPRLYFDNIRFTVIANTPPIITNITPSTKLWIPISMLDIINSFHVKAFELIKPTNTAIVDNINPDMHPNLIDDHDIILL
jgi:hypothetical protein